jgi:hypothetical protein
MRVKIIAVTLLCLTLSYVGSVSGQESRQQSQAEKQFQQSQQYQIVFSIFENSSAGRYAYLRDSIQAMLASRLAARDKINVLEKTFSREELKFLKKEAAPQSLSIGGHNADYLVTGEIFALTSGLETQVDLYPLIPEKQVLHFSAHSTTPDTLIADVEQLAREIAQAAFGEKPIVADKKTTIGDGAGDTAFVTAHPEEAYKRNAYVGSVVGVAGSGVIAKGRGAQLKKTLPVDMRAMAVGDVTGDGEQKILLLAGGQLQLFGAKDEAIQLLAETSLPSTVLVHAINLADLDGDGEEEIYLSGTNGLYVSSMIMKYDITSGFQVISRNIPWYLRPLFVPGKGWQLAGQKRGLDKIDLVSPGVYLLSLDKKYAITQGARLPLPPSLNLFDFTYADLDGDGFYEIAAVDQKEKLRIYSPSNELMWVSLKNFGGSKIYLGPSQGDATAHTDQQNFTVDENSSRELIFVPGKILVTDVDRDGKQDLVIGEAEKARIGNYFRRLRFYDDGAVVGLSWNGSMLTEMWRTGNYRGYLAAYDFTLLDEKPRQEKTQKEHGRKTIGRLFVGNLPRSGSLVDLLPGAGETELSIYDLEFTYETPPEKTKP